MSTNNGSNNKRKNGSVQEPLEKKLWKAADKLRKNMDAIEKDNPSLKKRLGIIVR